jgi:uncharacterized membrane protein YfcA
VGSLTTPALIFLGLEPLVAVGTDLLYATVTRVIGVILHERRSHVRYDIVWRLLAGSIPAVLIGHYLINTLPKTIINSHLTLLLGIVLIATAILSIIKEEIGWPFGRKWIYVYILGFIVGLTVQFTSVGAGVIVSFALMNVALIDPREVVGTVMFYGLALSTISFLSYASIHSIDYTTALLLITGTIPGVYLGFYFSTRISREKLKPLINITILVIGTLILLKRLL